MKTKNYQWKYKETHPLEVSGNILNQAAKYTKSQAVLVNLQVEFWDLRTHKKLHGASYDLGGRYKTYDPSIPLESSFIQSEEIAEIRFAELCEKMSRNIVRDFLSAL